MRFAVVSARNLQVRGRVVTAHDSERSPRKETEASDRAAGDFEDLLAGQTTGRDLISMGAPRELDPADGQIRSLSVSA